jgi:hypothetical protein
MKTLLWMWWLTPVIIVTVVDGTDQKYLSLSQTLRLVGRIFLNQKSLDVVACTSYPRNLESVRNKSPGMDRQGDDFYASTGFIVEK